MEQAILLPPFTNELVPLWHPPFLVLLGVPNILLTRQKPNGGACVVADHSTMKQLALDYMVPMESEIQLTRVRAYVCLKRHPLFIKTAINICPMKNIEPLGGVFLKKVSVQKL